MVYFDFRWFNFEKVIEALVAKKVFYTSVERLQTYAKEVCFIEDDDQFNTMLNFYHNLGLVVKHRSTVVLKAQWLIDLFKQLITIPHFDKVVRSVSEQSYFSLITLQRCGDHSLPKRRDAHRILTWLTFIALRGEVHC